MTNFLIASLYLWESDRRLTILYTFKSLFFALFIKNPNKKSWILRIFTKKIWSNMRKCSNKKMIKITVFSVLLGNRAFLHSPPNLLIQKYQIILFLRRKMIKTYNFYGFFTCIIVFMRIRSQTDHFVHFCLKSLITQTSKLLCHSARALRSWLYGPHTLRFL